VHFCFRLCHQAATPAFECFCLLIRDFLFDFPIPTRSIDRTAFLCKVLGDFIHIGFFEEIGLYFHRGLVVFELVDEILPLVVARRRTLT
jgi:hypothetical protein